MRGRGRENADRKSTVRDLNLARHPGRRADLNRSRILEISSTVYSLGSEGQKYPSSTSLNGCPGKIYLKLFTDTILSLSLIHI